MITGVHHIAMKCRTTEEVERVKDFYINTLGMKIRREWPDGIMIDTGNCLLEVFTNGDGVKELGALRHIAFNNSLTTIEALAFANCNLNTVIISKTVKFIETSAFEGNIGLQQVIFEHSANDIIYLNDNIFNKCPNVTIISKNDSIAEYAKRNKLKFRAN